MASLILLFLCLIVGIAIRYVKAFPSSTPVVLNQFIIYISLPAMALHYLPKVSFGAELIYPIAMPWIGFLLAVIIFGGLGQILGWSNALIGCLILTAGLGNTSFVGIPIIDALYGEEGLKTLVMVDLPGTFLVFSTLGIFVAIFYSRGSNDFSAIVKKMFSFPPFIMFLVAMSINFLGWKMPQQLDEVFFRLSTTVTPLALVSVGYQLKVNLQSRHWNYLIMGLAFQLLLFPAFIYVLYKIVMKQDGLAIDVTIMEAAMAPMISASIVASSYGLKPQLSTMMVGVGIPLSFITLTCWYYFMRM